MVVKIEKKRAEPATCGLLVDAHRDGVWLSAGDALVSLSHQESVQVWRRMLGELDTPLEVGTPRVRLWFDGENGDDWILDTDGLRVRLGQDECLALAWALKRAVASSMGGRFAEGRMEARREVPFYIPPEPLPPEGGHEDSDGAVWVLMCASCPAPSVKRPEGAGGIGMSCRVCATKVAAQAGLREFMRGPVNCAHDDAHWADLAEFNRDVDRVIDEIIDEADRKGREDRWVYDGTARSFAVSLVKVPVDGKGVRA